MLKSKNPDKERPSKHMKKWNDEEETLLLEELSKNMDIRVIAQSHNRTIGGISARRRQIAYNLYSNNTTMEEIILKTKLEEDEIMQIIKRRQNCHPIHSMLLDVVSPIYQHKLLISL